MTYTLIKTEALQGIAHALDIAQALLNSSHSIHGPMMLEEYKRVAALLAEPCEPAGYEYRWTNPGDNPEAFALQWRPVEARIGSTGPAKVEELQTYLYMGKSVYEVRPLFAPKEPTKLYALKELCNGLS